MEITPSIVTHIAELCKLKLTPEEIEKFTTELSSIVKYVNTIQKLSISNTLSADTSDHKQDACDTLLSVSNTLSADPNCVFKTETPLREDIIKEGFSISEVLANAPAVYNNYFVVPKLI
ncbi:MAG: aspartyl/glutamyl-tRNA amidotransferase subunit C [bacterium]|nr:aspartyl/glutamyl-tRNA amidotransferase subunit C [bacterium]